MSAEAKPFLPALKDATDVIVGFESPLGMELLATVDWIVHEQHVAPDIAEVRNALAHWPAGQNAARRKEHLFDERLIGLALERLRTTLFAPTTQESKRGDA